jgi:hypothetical protein
MSQRFAGRTPERANGDRATLRSTAPKKPRVPRKAKTEAAAPAAQTTPQPPANAVPAQPAPPPPTQLKPAASATAKSADDKPKQDNGGAQIVRLDAFRKK